MKCFYTGIELNGNDAYLLDLAQARLIIRDLKNRLSAVEKLIGDLGVIDKVEVFIQQKGKKITQHRKRLICKELAAAFLASYEGKNIFITWTEWIKRINRSNEKNKKAGNKV